MEYVPFGGKDKIKLSVALVKNLICIKTKSGKTCSDNDAMKFMMMCSARLLNPWEGDAFLVGYDGREGPTFSLITAHQAFLKRAELNPEYDGMKSGIIVQQEGELKDLEGDFYTEGQIVKGGWATIFFKNRKQPMHKRIRLERFQKSWGIWQDDPAGMISKCAEADALRSSFPTMLGGLYLREETKGVAEESKVTSPIFTTPPPEEPIPDAEVIQESPAEPEPAPAQAPSKPAPAPKAASRPQSSPSNPEPQVKTESPVKKMREAIAEAGLTVEKVLSCLCEMGAIDAETNTIEQLLMESPSVFQMLEKQKNDIFNRVKGIA